MAAAEDEHGLPEGSDEDKSKMSLKSGSCLMFASSHSWACPGVGGACKIPTVGLVFLIIFSAGIL